MPTPALGCGQGSRLAGLKMTRLGIVTSCALLSAAAATIIVRVAARKEAPLGNWQEIVLLGFLVVLGLVGSMVLMSGGPP